MSRRISGLLLAVLLTSAVSGCGAWTAGSAGRMPEPAGASPAASDAIGYTPYTEDTIAPAVETALSEYRTYHAVMTTSVGRIVMDVRLGRAGHYDIAMTMSGPEAMEMIFTGGRVFVRLPGDEKYTQLSDEAVDQILGQVGDMTPTRLAADLADGMASMHYAGSLTTRGRKLYGYVVELDPEYLADQIGEPLPEGAMTDMEYRIWLDEDGLWWRSDVEVFGEHVEVRISRWGMPVHIEAPPPSQIDYYNA